MLLPFKNVLSHYQHIFLGLAFGGITLLGCVIGGCTRTPSKPTNTKTAIPAATPPPSKKPTIMVFTSKGGNGHMAACAVLKTTFPDYNLKIVNPLEDIFGQSDPFKILSGGSLDGEQFYNKIIQHGWVRTANFMARYPGAFVFRRNYNAFFKRFSVYFEKQKPDMVISLVPLFNASAGNAAKELSIPYLLITLDADLTFWLQDMKKCTNQQLKMTVGTMTSHIKKQLADARIKPSQVHVVGHPLRADFFEPKNCAAIRTTWNIPNKPTAMIIRGGTGSNQQVACAKALANVDYPLHMLVCIGKNPQLESELKKVKLNKNVSLSVIPFTQRISDLMAVSDVIITQPSPNVCNEALHFGLPILVDNAAPCLFWEQPTIDWIKIRGSGTIFKRTKELPKLVKSHLGKKKPLSARTTTSPFNNSIKKIVQRMLEAKSLFQTKGLFQ